MRGSPTRAYYEFFMYTIAWSHGAIYSGIRTFDYMQNELKKKGGWLGGQRYYGVFEVSDVYDDRGLQIATVVYYKELSSG